MKSRILTVILILIFLVPFIFIHANDRKQPNYIFYKAELLHIDRTSKLIAGTVKIKMDMDKSYVLVSIVNPVFSSSIKSITIHGPALADETAPVVFTLPSENFIDHKIEITNEEAEDIAHGLYYVEVSTADHPAGEVRGHIRLSSESNPIPNDFSIDFIKLREDFIRYFQFVRESFQHSKTSAMKMPEQAEINHLSAQATNQLSSNLPTILSKYVVYKQIPDYKNIAYKPRQFDTGLVFESSQSAVTNPSIYKGWDFFNAPNDESSQTVVTPKWITLKLNRPAVVALIWRGGKELPQWLSSWTAGTLVEINNVSYPVYIKKYQSTEINLGSINDSQTGEKKDSYLILLAEENGKPSKAPVVPDGLEKPIPNSPCPAWVHDQYVAKGPDGNMYAAWHPQIDPIFWCYFGHEHGTDPKVFDENISIPFGYAGAKMGMQEKHVGFKVYVWDDTYGYRFLALQHQGTSTNQAICGRYHELDFFVKKIESHEILAKRYFVGDYGVSRSLVTGKPYINTKCPDQSSTLSSGARFLPIEDERKATESWVVASKNVIGFNFADFVVSTLDSVRMCKDYACDSMEITSNTGTLREISYVAGLGPRSGLGYSGKFYTGPTGTSLVKSDDPIAVEQYTKPGISIASDLPQSIHFYNSTHCFDSEGFGSMLICDINNTAAPSMRENSIKVPN